MYETELRLVNANPRRISSDCGSVCIEVGIEVGAVVDAVSEAPLEVEEASLRSERGLNEKLV